MPKAAGDCRTGLGYFDDIESLIGLGFVACQRYLTATYGWMKFTKHAALAVGPTHRSGLTIAEIANHAANYWKHQDEWRSQNKTKQQERTEAAIASVGARLGDYPITHVLTELAGGYDFKPLLRDLASWHDELCADAKA